jgi:glycosyltransferase involved in cell wall biosynthesis
MKKIGLFLATTPHMGGLFQYGQTILTALAALPKDAYETTVICSSDNWSKQAHELGVAICNMPPYGSFTLVARLWRLLRLPVKMWRAACLHVHPLTNIMRREKCDLWIYPGQDMWSYMIPLPSLGTIHDLMHRYERRFPEASARGRYYLRDWDCINMCRWTKGILVDSETGRQHVVESYGHDPKKVYVLPYIAPPYLHRASDLQAIDALYNLPPKFIFYPAQFWKHKNHERLVLAAARLKEILPDLHLVFTGLKSRHYAVILKCVQDSSMTDRIHFLNHVSDNDMPALYSRARALVMPTFFGPTNIPPLEAFAAGCPVAISDIYGMPEQVGDAALLFNPNSIEEIAQCIRRLWTDDQLCLELIRKGHQRTADWNMHNFSKAFQDILSKVSDDH